MVRCLGLVLAVGIVSAVGCNRVAPQAAKVAAQGERAAARAFAGGAAKSGANRGEQVRKWADRAVTALDAYDRYQGLKAAGRRAPERFPFDPRSVVPVTNQPVTVDPLTGAVAFPNNFGGYSFFDGAGRPIGFRAWNAILKEERYFDPFGNGL